MRKKLLVPAEPLCMCPKSYILIKYLGYVYQNTVFSIDFNQIDDIFSLFVNAASGINDAIR